MANTAYHWTIFFFFPVKRFVPLNYFVHKQNNYKISLIIITIFKLVFPIFSSFNCFKHDFFQYNKSIHPLFYNKTYIHTFLFFFIHSIICLLLIEWLSEWLGWRLFFGCIRWTTKNIFVFISLFFKYFKNIYFVKTVKVSFKNNLTDGQHRSFIDINVKANQWSNDWRKHIYITYIHTYIPICLHIIKKILASNAILIKNY